MDEPVVLTVELSSGGVTAALVSSDLAFLTVEESAWQFVDDGSGAFVLSPLAVREQVTETIRRTTASGRAPRAVVLTSMMHTLLVVDAHDGAPRGPVRTWRDRGRGMDVERLNLDARAYRERTGCYLHPSFPATKLAAMRRRRSAELEGSFRLESVKAFVHRLLTGESVEDVSTASASGLSELHRGNWDTETLDALDIDTTALPPIVGVSTIAGGVNREAARFTGLPSGVPVVAGLGDGFAATIGSGAGPDSAVSITLGTTSSVRRIERAPSPAPDGTFCYRFGPDRFLRGCASSNGGNVLDWARATFSMAGSAPHPTRPLFLPFLEGERSPFWNANLQPRWVDVEKARTVEDLAAAVIESVVFLMRSFYDRVGPASAAVLSGNGFRDRNLAALLADLLDVPLLEPQSPGLATVRGAARVAFEALGIDTTGALDSLVADAEAIPTSGPASIRSERRERHARFDEVLRGVECGAGVTLLRS